MKYTDLDVWRESKQLALLVYQQTKNFPSEEIYGITNQIRRSAVSIPSNIAEGLGRQTTKDTINFLYISRGSLYELETQILIAIDLNYLNNEAKELLLKSIESVKKLLNGFINYYKKLL